MNKKIVSLLIVMTIALASLSACGSEEEEYDGVVDIFDYVTVEFSGEDGNGTSNITIDYDGLELEMVGGQDALEELDSTDDLSTLTSYINVCASLSFSSDKHENLSNGDVVTVTVVYDEDAAEDAGVVFGDELSHEYEVSGLE